MVHGARLRQRRAGRSRRRADAQAVVRPSVHRAQPRSGDRACRKAEGDRAGAGLQSVLLQFRLGGERHPGQARLVSQQRARPAAEEENRQPHEGLSRRYRGRRVVDRAAGQPPRFRPAAAGLLACRLSASLPVRAERRERGGLRDPARRRTRRAHRRGGSRHRRRLHRRAGDGRRRRDRAAKDLFREDHAGLPQVRRVHDQRRGDLRLRPARHDIRLREARISLRNRSRSPRRCRRAICRLPAS